MRREKYYRLNIFFLKYFCLLRREKGQTLVEYSLLLSLTATINSIIVFFQKNILVAIIVAGLLIFLLLRKPKLFFVVILVILLLIAIPHLISFFS